MASFTSLSSAIIRHRIPIAISALIAVFLVLFFIVRSHEREAAVLRADPESILADPILRETAITRGKVVFERYCSSCHGPKGKPDQALGIPDLTDGEHLYESTKVADIQDIVRFGIRSGNKSGKNLAIMPAYASKIPDKAEPLPPQTPEQIEEITQYLLSFTGRQTDAAKAKLGANQYQAAGCWDCHGRDAGGDTAIGAPNLTDSTWLFGGSHDVIHRTISYGRAGISPAFNRVLTQAQQREVAVYVASLAQTPAKKP